MKLKRSIVVAVAALALPLSACGSSDSGDSGATDTGTTAAAPSTSTCPSGPQPADAPPQWTPDGDTGSIAVTAPTETAAPEIKVTTPPFSVNQTVVHVLSEGTGPVIAPSATVSVCYVGVNGRDGATFDSSYNRGAPVEFPLDNVVPGFQKAIAGQKVGSAVAVAVTSADGYAQGNPGAGINPGDTLVFVLQILEAQN